MAQRVVVFVDYQNAYRRARDAFGLHSSYVDGQIDPLAIGHLLDSTAKDWVLSGVRVYRGMPSPKRDPVGHAATQRQIAQWSNSPLVTVSTRALNYRHQGAPQEKGIDVQIAVDFVMMAMKGQYDLGVLFSADSDLHPAVEAVGSSAGITAVHLAAWWDRRLGGPRVVKVDGEPVYTHVLRRSDYEAVHDPTDYTVGAPRRRRPPRTDAGN